MSKRYIATAPLVVVEDTTGAQQYVYQGREITFDVDAERIESLVEGGFVEEIEADDVVQVAFAGPPAKRASAADWHAFAVSDGMDPEEAEKLGKKGLIARYLEGQAPEGGEGSEGGETVTPPNPDADSGTSPAGN